MTFLLALLGKALARPSLLIGCLGLLVFGGREIHHWREHRADRSALASLERQRDEQARQKLEFRAALSDVTANRDMLVRRLTEQNNAIQALQSARQAEAKEAELAAVRALQRGRIEAMSLRAPTTQIAPGHQAMNEWLAERVK